MIQQDKFQVQLKYVGNKKLWVTYKLMQHENPFTLGKNTVGILANNFCEPMAQDQYQYWLACSILQQVGYNAKTIIHDINTSHIYTTQGVIKQKEEMIEHDNI